MSTEIKVPDSVGGRVQLTRFFGGERRGPCVQITVPLSEMPVVNDRYANFVHIRLTDLAQILPALAEVCALQPKWNEPAMAAEWEAWKLLCTALRKCGAVTKSDLMSRLSDVSTPGQKLFYLIRNWGETVRQLERSYETHR